MSKIPEIFLNGIFYHSVRRFDPNLRLALNQKVEQLLRVDHGLAEVGHETNEGRVPLVNDFGESCLTRGHQDHSAPVVKFGDCVIVNPEILNRVKKTLLEKKYEIMLLGIEICIEIKELGK